MHPFISGLENLTLDELQTKMSEITKKMNYVSRTGNNYLIYQLQLALNTYNDAYQTKIQEQFSKSKDNGSLTDNIDIS
jgi:hypothetical protein